MRSRLVEKMEDLGAVRSAVRTVYRPWLEGVVTAFQEAVAASTSDGYETAAPPEASEGTCLLFSDGLRFDIAQRLLSMLSRQGINGRNQSRPYCLAVGDQHGETCDITRGLRTRRRHRF